MQSSENVSTVLAWLQCVLTGIIFNKSAHCFRMMDVAVVQNKDASGTWVRVGKGDLLAALAMFQN